MNIQERQSQDIFFRVGEFGAQHITQFPAASLAASLFADLAAVSRELNDFDSRESSQSGAKRQRQVAKTTTREMLFDELRAINRTARVAALTEPKIEGRFELPKTMTDLELLSIAQGFAINAAPFAAIFPRFALPVDFLDRLNAAIADFQTSLQERHAVRTAKTETTAAIDAVIERGTVIVKQLDVIVKNTFRADAATLAAWKRASHPERTKGKTAPETTKATTAGA